MDLAVFLQSIGEESPSGDNLVYDPAFAEMERAAQPLTDDSGAGTPADFATVEEKALEVLERSHGRGRWRCDHADERSAGFMR